jgi:hypothetical protein
MIFPALSLISQNRCIRADSPVLVGAAGKNDGSERIFGFLNALIRDHVRKENLMK